MKSLVTVFVALGLITPVAAMASIDAAWVDQMIENAKAGNGTYVESYSSSNTGGQHASAGQTITTGDSYSSSRVETHVTSGSDGGSVNVHVESTRNGTTTTQEYSEQLSGNKSATVEVRADASDATSTSHIRVNGADVQGTTSIVASSHMDLTRTEKAKAIFLAVPQIVKKIFAYFWFF